jgi:hypothetical protein
MWLVNLALAFLPAVTVWLIGSWAIAHFIFRKEASSPQLMGRASWKALEVALVSGVFVGSALIWIGLAMFLDFVVER